MPNLTITVTASSGISAYWVWVDEQNVPLVNGEGSVAVDIGKHYLSWHMLGEQGASLSIEGKVGDDVVVAVKKTTVHTDGMGHGVRSFTV